MARASCHNLQVSLGNGLDMRNIAVGNYSPMFVEGVFFTFYHGIFHLLRGGLSREKTRVEIHSPGGAGFQ